MTIAYAVEQLDTVTAAAMMLRGLTVQALLRQVRPLQAGETILVQAAGSGIGSIAIRVAKALGCTVIATAGDDEKPAPTKPRQARAIATKTCSRRFNVRSELRPSSTMPTKKLRR